MCYALAKAAQGSVALWGLQGAGCERSLDLNAQMKRRLVVVTGVIVVVLAIVLAVVGSGGSARSLSIADALGGDGRFNATDVAIEEGN